MCSLSKYVLLKQSKLFGLIFCAYTKGLLCTCYFTYQTAKKVIWQHIEVYLFSPKFAPVKMVDFEIQFYYLMRTPAYRREETICDVICMLFRQIRNLSLMNRDVETETFFFSLSSTHFFME